MVEPTDLTPLLGLGPTASELAALLARLSAPDGAAPPSSVLTPAVATYPDIVYLSYYALGLSLSFEPTISSYKPKYRLTSIDQLECDKLYCVGIDVYNRDDEDAQDKKPSSTTK